jgi:retron-type reverse transcriptase
VSEILLLTTANFRGDYQPIFDVQFLENSYGFRPGRGCKDALREVDRLLKAGYTHVVDANLKSYFDTIPHDQLMAQIGESISDGRVLDVIRGWLQQDILHDSRRCHQSVASQSLPASAGQAPDGARVSLGAVCR